MPLTAMSFGDRTLDSIGASSHATEPLESVSNLLQTSSDHTSGPLKGNHHSSDVPDQGDNSPTSISTHSRLFDDYDSTKGSGDEVEEEEDPIMGLPEPYVEICVLGHGINGPVMYHEAALMA